jgi:hypothetical protein
MPLDVMNPPVAAYEVVRSAMSDLASRAGFGTPSLRRADPSTLGLSTPHRVAVIPLNGLRRGGALRDVAQTTSWRFLLHQGDRVIAAVDTIETKEGRYQFGHINEGPFTTATEEAIRRAERLDAVRKGQFEPVLVMAPALYVVALWLQNRSGDSDWFLPLPPTPEPLVSYQPTRSDEFQDILRRLAEKVPPDSGRNKDPSGG